MHIAKLVLTLVGKGKELIQMEIGDEKSGLTRSISPDGCLKLQECKGKPVQFRTAYVHGNAQGYTPRAALVGSYDGKGKLNIAVGEVGKPINSDADVVSRESYEIDPKLFEAFCMVFKATMADSKAVKAIAQAARRSKVVEVPITF